MRLSGTQLMRSGCGRARVVHVRRARPAGKKQSSCLIDSSGVCGFCSRGRHFFARARPSAASRTAASEGSGNERARAKKGRLAAAAPDFGGAQVPAPPVAGASSGERAAQVTGRALGVIRNSASVRSAHVRANFFLFFFFLFALGRALIRPLARSPFKFGPF